MIKTEWDYTTLAPFFDKRADYSLEAVDRLLKAVSATPEKIVADIGAGTGRLTKMMLSRGLTVKAVEPNAEMRKLGTEKTQGKKVSWVVGTGEKTGLEDHSVHLAVFGSSFGLTDRRKAMLEVSRIVTSQGWFACLWNHRDLSDPLQALVERAIKAILPTFTHGPEREDQTEIITASGLFNKVELIEGNAVQTVSVANYIEAFKSHEGLARQAGELLPSVIESIRKRLEGLESLQVPHVTRVWYAQLRRAS